MQIPTEYPVTVVTADGDEYEVPDATSYINAVYGRGHTVKAAPQPRTATPAPAAPAPADKPDLKASASLTKE